MSAAFAPASRPRPASAALAVSLRGEVDSIGNNIAVKELLRTVEDRQLLSQVAASGLLSKAQKAGVTLSSLEPFLELASRNPDILVSACAGNAAASPRVSLPEVRGAVSFLDR